jgi:hypothetical protein
MTNWQAMQVSATQSADGQRKVRAQPGGVLPRYMSGGSWCASLSKSGACRRKLKGCGAGAAGREK